MHINLQVQWSVIPVLKKGDYLQSNSYRPILLTSNISKVTAKLVSPLPRAKQYPIQQPIWLLK